MPDSLITLMENKIAELIGAVTSTEYNFNWNGVIQGDIISAPFPSAKLELVEEKNIDEPEGEDIVGPTGAFSEAYYNAITIKILIGGTHQPSGPVADRNDLFKALDDLKRLFGIKYTLDNSGASAMLYRGFKLVDNNGLYMESSWLVRYYQSRKEPGQTAEV